MLSAAKATLPGADNNARAMASDPPALAPDNLICPSQAKPSPKQMSPPASARSPLIAKPPGFTIVVPSSRSPPAIFAPSSFTSPENRQLVSRKWPVTLRFAALKPGITLPLKEVNPIEAQYKSGLVSNQHSSKISASRTLANERRSSPGMRAPLNRIMGSWPAAPPDCSPSAREAITSARTVRSSPHPSPWRGSSDDGSPVRRTTSVPWGNPSQRARSAGFRSVTGMHTSCDR